MNMQSLCDYIDSLPIISTHEHHQPFELKQPATLEFLFSSGYVGWMISQPNTPEQRESFLELISGNSYFVWYEKALNDLFDFGGEITKENWDVVSAQCSSALANPGFHEWIFKEKCRYLRAIIDTYWQPGSDNNRPDLYSPTLRVNCWLYGSNTQLRDHNGNNAQVIYGKCQDLDEYLAKLESTIAEAKKKGAVALKSALAYDRPLLFKPRSKEEVAKIFGKQELTDEELAVFGDFIYDEICRLAAKYELPFQNHVGLGKLPGTNPMNLVPMIEKHPETKFVLFHMGYPWIDEVIALSHNYENVYPDLCWLPSISTIAGVRAVHTLIETARDSSRVCWGGDSWLVTESYAASLAVRWTLKKVLCEKVEYGYLTEARARNFAERILYKNAATLYGIKIEI